MANSLSKTFLTETGEDSHATHAFTASVPNFDIAYQIGAASGTGNIATHPEVKAIYISNFHGATVRPTGNGPSALSDTVDSRGTENSLGRVATEKRQLYG